MTDKQERLARVLAAFRRGDLEAESVAAAIADLIDEALRKIVPRSPHWPSVRAQHLRDEPACAWCGAESGLDVHHILPVHVAPDRELDPENLITLCDNPGPDAQCHLRRGHLDDWKKWNQEVRDQCREKKSDVR